MVQVHVNGTKPALLRLSRGAHFGEFRDDVMPLIGAGAIYSLALRRELKLRFMPETNTPCDFVVEGYSLSASPSQMTHPHKGGYSSKEFRYRQFALLSVILIVIQGGSKGGRYMYSLSQSNEIAAELGCDIRRGCLRCYAP